MIVTRVPRIDGALLFTPKAHVDERGFFSRTFDAEVMREAGIDPCSFLQDSLSRSARGVVPRRCSSSRACLLYTSDAADE